MHTHLQAVLACMHPENVKYLVNLTEDKQTDKTREVQKNEVLDL